MRTRKIISLLLVLTLLASCLSGLPVSAQPAEEVDWGNAHWIWSNADEDRCETELWEGKNGYQYEIVSAEEGPSMLFQYMAGGTKTLTYENELASERDVWMNFRRDFTLKEAPESALINIATDSKYWLWLNGELVVLEGQLRRGPTQYDHYYETVDLAPYLKEGKNTLAIQVWYWGTGGNSCVPSGSGGLLFSSDLVDAATGKVVESGDGNWWALRDPAYAKGDRAIMRTEPVTSYDAQNEIDWINPDYDPATSGDGWNLATPIGIDTEDPGYAGDGPWNELWERPIPQWKDYGLTLSDYTVEGNTYTVCLPYNCQFTPYLKLGENTEAGKTIRITTDTESQYAQYGASSNTYTTKAGAQEYEAKNWINGDYLYFEIPEGVEVEALGFHETGYAVESGEDTDFLGYFDSVIDYDDPSYSQFTGGRTWTEEEANLDNNFYDEIWKKSVRTLYVTIRDTYMDCPDRERSQYIGDAINELEEAFYSLGTSVNPLSANAIKNICDWQIETEIDGRTYYLMSNVRPGGNAQEISCQSLGTALAASNYYLFTGDSELPQYCFQKLYNYLTNYDMITEGEEAGLIANRSSRYHMYDSNLWQWFDWGNNQDTRLETNLWWYISASCVRQMAEIDGVPATDEQKQWLDERLASIEKNFEKFWNEDLQAYATEWNEEDWYSTSALEDGSHLVDDRANALAVVYGLVPKEKYPQMRDVFMGTDNAPAYENASIYMEKYVIQALYLMGYDEEAMVRMTKRHISEVNDTTSSTMPEYWLKDGKGTKNHGWSGGSMIALSRYATGVEPTEAGYTTWHVIPQMGSFTSIDTRVPSEIGNIDVTIKKDAEAGTLEMTVVSPGGNAEIWVPVEDAGATVAQVAGVDAEYLGIQEAYQKQYAVYAVSEAGTYSFAASSGNVLSVSAPETAQVNADFVVSVITDAATSNVCLFNENDMALGCKAVEVTENDDGTKTWDLTLSVGTVGQGRTFKVVTKGTGTYYKDSGVRVSLDIISIPANIISFDLPEEAVANRTFIITATTDLSATKIEVYNETGMKMGLTSLSSKVVDGQKVWTGVMSIGTQGERTFSCYAVNKYGARSEALTDNISVKAFA